MIYIQQWAERHEVSKKALDELMMIFEGLYSETENIKPGVKDTESGLQSEVRLEGTAKGVRLMRNNVGACMDETGRLIRYGLAHESKQQNEKIKSSDLIGIRRVLITETMVGGYIGQFVARECKKPGWVFDGRDPHQLAQLRFLNFIVSMGGDACFVSQLGTL